ncbi:Putative ribonuclease H protein At1g65750 [Linum perenne]
MEKKLEGWKLKNLSLAGRVTLAGSVLNSIPSYAMQTALLPVSTTNAIDAKIRNFVWGDTIDKKKTHLLSWDVICRPKSQGGLGLKKARELNDAYMMKMGWLLLQAPGKLWVQVLTSKYLKNTDQGLTLRRSTGGSSLWRGIRRNWSEMAEACQHSIRNGKSTLFWQHRWLDSGTKLIEWATRPLDDRELEMSVAEATTEPGVWNWEFLRDRLPPSCLEQIAGMDAPIVCNEEDGMIWGPDSRGRFSIASAYEITTATNYDSAANLWKCVWKWQGPNRIKHFLWLVAHNRLLTNSERNRRHMTTEDCCRLCPNSTEDSLHVLRDCRSARDFWVNFAPVSKDASFFTGTIQEWLPKYIGDADFGLQFGIALWLIWKTRNEDIFEGKKVTSDQLRLRVHSWIAGVRETMKASSFLLSGIDDRRRETLISWIPAPDDWVTVNTDGSVLQPQSLAAGGGLVRDSHGNKIAAFSANFGRCSIMRAELRAAALGLEVAWNSGCRKVNIQVDSTAAINAIQGDPNSSGRHCQVLQQIRNLCDRDWTTAVTHTFREGNRVADLLAHHGHSLAYGCHILANCNPDIRFALFSDCIGASTPRMILLNN